MMTHVPTDGAAHCRESRKDSQIAFRVARQTVEKFEECHRLSGKTKIELFEEMVNSLYERLTQEK